MTTETIEQQEKNLLTSDQLAGPLRFEKRANPQLEFLTNTGVFLWHGREATDNKSFIIGMDSYLKRLVNIERAITQDDPFADRTYYQIQMRLDEAEMELQEKIESLKMLLKSQHRRMVYPETETAKPAIVEVEHHSKLGMRTCNLLLLADDAAKIVRDAHHRGIVSAPENSALIKDIERIVRSLLSIALRWKYMGVTRDDLRAGTQPAREAIKAFGKLEEEFRVGTTRSTFAPNLPKNRQAALDKAAYREAKKAS